MSSTVVRDDIFDDSVLGSDIARRGEKPFIVATLRQCRYKIPQKGLSRYPCMIRNGPRLVELRASSA
jgi:hypothetical protein